MYQMSDTKERQKTLKNDFRESSEILGVEMEIFS